VPISDRPAHQGIETLYMYAQACSNSLLSVTAPLIRGLKLFCLVFASEYLLKTISDRPAHQGIETSYMVLQSLPYRYGTISDRPAHQGIETLNQLYNTVC